jgi:hypothetical protein
MAFVWARSNRRQVRLEGKAWRIGSQAAIPRVSLGRIPCRGRNGARLASFSFNLELFSLFRFQFDSFIEISHSIWRGRKCIRLDACIHVWSPQRKPSEERSYVTWTHFQSLLRHGCSETKVTWVNRALLASSQMEESRIVLCVLLDKVTFKLDSVHQINIRSF